LDVSTAPPIKRLPALLTDAELIAFYNAIWQARQLTHAVMLKLLLFTGMRNAELVHLRLTDIDLQTCQVRITQGKSHKDRAVLFPSGFRGEFAQYGPVRAKLSPAENVCCNPLYFNRFYAASRCRRCCISSSNLPYGLMCA
jgi:site-specific recombinase XerD